MAKEYRLNIRMTEYKKNQLKRKAKKAGFHTVSSYVKWLIKKEK